MFCVRPAGFTVTVRLPGVALVLGEALNHAPPAFVNAAALTLRAVPLLPSATVRETGLVAPASKANARADLPVLRAGAAVIASVTGTVDAWPPAVGVKVMLPAYEPADNPAVFTLTVILAGDVPVAGETENQPPPEVLEEEVVKARPFVPPTLST